MENAREVVAQMGERILHRGPDGSGTWCDESAGFALNHRRLAILDLSAAGHQPMVSSCGRFVIAFNGEIYNHKELRASLDNSGVGSERAPTWRGHSDTEVLLAGLAHWGVEVTLQRLNGMFAFALWDRRERMLYLARDRMGEKPLYYGRSGDTFLFGSELKALTSFPGWHGDVDRDALSMYLRFNYVPAPWSIYRGIKKLLPAHYVVIREGGKSIGEPVCYWDLRAKAAVACSKADASMSAPELVDQLQDMLLDVVGLRMEADVPLGAFLSGGLDSSLIVAMMQAQSKRPVKTFTIGNTIPAYDEAVYADAVARHLGTDHTTLYASPEDALNIVPDIATIWDEPFSDSSQLPTYLVSRLAKSSVTVSLSGDGGDELFCGYNRYALGYGLWSRARQLSPATRHALAGIISRLPARQLDKLLQLLPRKVRFLAVADRLDKLADILSMDSEDEFYRRLVSTWKHPDTVVKGASEPDIFPGAKDGKLMPDGFRERMMLTDMLTYLPGDVLTKVDRASMAVSLEARAPFLDHRLVEFAWRVPTEFKYREGKTKWLLREVLCRFVPKTLIERPKMGFGVPIEHWLRGPLRDWAENLLDERRLQEQGYFEPHLIRQTWSEHLSGRRRCHYELWAVLMFQAWLEKWQQH